MIGWFRRLPRRFRDWLGLKIAKLGFRIAGVQVPAEEKPKPPPTPKERIAEAAAVYDAADEYLTDTQNTRLSDDQKKKLRSRNAVSHIQRLREVIEP